MSPKPFKVAGIDGCRAGWCVAFDVENRVQLKVFPSLEALDQEIGPFDRYLIDMPMGLSDTDCLREIDTLAKGYLAPKKRASVFQTPCRAAVYAPSYESAKANNIQLLGKSISIQAWNICPKIRALDEFLQEKKHLRHSFYECHPEIAFKMLNAGKDLIESKKSAAGQTERLAILQKTIQSVAPILEKALENTLRKNVLPDDFIDALALYQSAKSSQKADFQYIEGKQKTDTKGIPMRMVFVG